MGLLMVLGSGAGRYRERMLEYERHKSDLEERELKKQVLRSELESGPLEEKRKATEQWRDLVEKGRELEKSDGPEAASPYYDAANKLAAQYGLPTVLPFGARKSGLEGLDKIASFRTKLGLQGVPPDSQYAKDMTRAFWQEFIKEYPHLGAYFAATAQQAAGQTEQPRQQAPQLRVSPSDLYQTAVQRGLLMPPTRGPLASSPSLPATGATPPLRQPPLGAWTPVQLPSAALSEPIPTPLSPPSTDLPLEPPESFVQYVTAPSYKDIHDTRQARLAAIKSILSHLTSGRLSPEGAYNAYVQMTQDTSIDPRTFETMYNEVLAEVDKARLAQVQASTERIIDSIAATARQLDLKADWQKHRMEIEKAMLEISRGNLALGQQRLSLAAQALARAIEQDNNLDVYRTHNLALRYAQLATAAELYESTKDQAKVYQELSDAFRAIAVEKARQKSGRPTAPQAPVSQTGAPPSAPVIPRSPQAPPAKGGEGAKKPASSSDAWIRRPGETSLQYLKRICATQMSPTDKRKLASWDSVQRLRKQGYSYDDIANAFQFMLSPEER